MASDGLRSDDRVEALPLRGQQVLLSVNTSEVQQVTSKADLEVFPRRAESLSILVFRLTPMARILLAVSFREACNYREDQPKDDLCFTQKKHCPDSSMPLSRFYSLAELSRRRVSPRLSASR